MTARLGFAIRRYLQDISAWVWSEQDDALHYGIKLQEETLTETLLLRMARDCQAHGLRTRMFNKIEEGGSKSLGTRGNGADWEWVFKTRFCCIGFRVQAKVLSSKLTGTGKLSVGSYDGLKVGDSQVDDLIGDATSSRYNPIYIFYNHP